MRIIAGTAPEAMEELPAPTHAFIGGSSGNMKEIVELLLEIKQLKLSKNDFEDDDKKTWLLLILQMEKILE